MRITGKTQRIIEAEGLCAALNLVGELLSSGDGLAKHGPRYWMSLGRDEHAKKAAGHAEHGSATDPDSGLPHSVHALARQMMVVAYDLAAQNQD